MFDDFYSTYTQVLIELNCNSKGTYTPQTIIARATATRDLTDLVRKGIFKSAGRGKRALRYILLMQKSQERVKK
jgi:predicted HTH transcriptional regulator